MDGGLTAARQQPAPTGLSWTELQGQAVAIRAAATRDAARGGFWF